MANKIDILIKEKDEAAKEIDDVTDSLGNLGDGLLKLNNEAAMLLVTGSTKRWKHSSG